MHDALGATDTGSAHPEACRDDGLNQRGWGLARPPFAFLGAKTCIGHMSEACTRLIDFEPVESSIGTAWLVDPPSLSWRQRKSGIWNHVVFGNLPNHGWKIHVSATLEEAPEVLRIASNIAFAQECSFKHLHSVDAFYRLHFKNESRLQSGKFIALYPSSEKVAAELLEALRLGLSGLSGIDVLTDRRYRDSPSVFYRWGAFTDSGRLNNRGEPEELVPDGNGGMVPDVRLPRFTLPDGIHDPFYFSAPTNPEQPKSVELDDFLVESVLRFTNAGGRYKATCTASGRQVVIKEARPHTGFVDGEASIPRLRREAITLAKANAGGINLAPQVLKHFSMQGHDFLVLEFVPGTALSEWIARENPLYSSLHRSKVHVVEYLERAGRILARVRCDILTLHDLGIAFGDISLGNIIIGDNDAPRLIDFEACTSIDNPVAGLRTPDFCLLDSSSALSARERDLHAIECLALALVLRLNTLAEVSRHVLDSLTEDLVRVVGDSLPRWWRDAVQNFNEHADRHSSFRRREFEAPSLDSPHARTDLRRALAVGIAGCFRPDSSTLFPSGSASRRGAFLGFGTGCSGVLLTLKDAGLVAPEMLERFQSNVRHALEGDILPVNYDVGLVGILEASAELSMTGLTECLLCSIEHRWEKIEDPSLGRGLTGLALAHLHAGRVLLAEDAMTRALNISKTYAWDKNGLLYGRSGVIAGACRFESLLGRHPELRGIVSQLILEELGQTERHPKAHSLSLRGETDGSRLLPYLSDGTAGLLFALMDAHHSQVVEYEIDHELLIALAADLGTPFMLEGSLMDGAAGLSVVLEIARYRFPEIAVALPDPGWTRIQRYLLPLLDGVGVLHPGTLKFDLSYSQGSAGIFAALSWMDRHSSLNIFGLRLPPIPSQVRHSTAVIGA